MDDYVWRSISHNLFKDASAVSAKVDRKKVVVPTLADLITESPIPTSLSTKSNKAFLAL